MSKSLPANRRAQLAAVCRSDRFAIVRTVFKPRCCWLSPLMLAAACQTGEPAAPVVIPAAVQGIFGACGPDDGGASVQVFNDGLLAASFDANWIARAGGDWEVELNDPLGKVLLHIARHDRSLKVSGPLAAKVPKLSVESGGFVQLGGRSTGLQAAEIPCLFRRVYPAAWRGEVTGRRSEGKQLLLSFTEAQRRMELAVTPAHPLKESCAELSWREYWVISHSLMLCLQNDSGARRMGSLTFQAYKLTWVQLDDG